MFEIYGPRYEMVSSCLCLDHGIMFRESSHEKLHCPQQSWLPRRISFLRLLLATKLFTGSVFEEAKLTLEARIPGMLSDDYNYALAFYLLLRSQSQK